MSITIISLVDGDILHANDGTVEQGRLKTTIQVAAPLGSDISVNGKKFERSGDIFSGDIVLDKYQNSIVVREEGSGQTETITVYWLSDLADKYRLSIEDNIWFLQDLTENANKYDSLFDNSYLAFLRDLHQRYGTKVHLYIFYQTDGFNLSQMTGKFKREWKEQAHWLNLSFHGLSEFPDMPYKYSGYEEVRRDCELVNMEIRRFAGEEVMSPVTALHWGEATIEGCRSLRDQGYLGQLGQFNIEEGMAPVSYYLTAAQRRHIKKRFLWKDNQENIVFVKSAIVIDRCKLEDIVPFLDAGVVDSHRTPFADLLTHEQYFHPHYEGYQPDFREKILTAVKWATDNGYTPSLLSDCLGPLLHKQ